MPKIYITEFAGLQTAAGVAHAQESAPVVMLPGTTQVLALSGASVPSAAMASRTRLVRLHALADCHIAIDRAATTSDLRLSAGLAEYFGIAPESVLHAIGA